MSIFDTIAGAFSSPGTDVLQAQYGAQQQQALAAAQDAEQKTRDAIAQAQQASQGPLDSESARLSAESRWRSLMGMQGAAWSFLQQPGK